MKKVIVLMVSLLGMLLIYSLTQAQVRRPEIGSKFAILCNFEVKKDGKIFDLAGGGYRILFYNDLKKTVTIKKIGLVEKNQFFPEDDKIIPGLPLGNEVEISREQAEDLLEKAGYPKFQW